MLNWWRIRCTSVGTWTLNVGVCLKLVVRLANYPKDTTDVIKYIWMAFLRSRMVSRMKLWSGKWLFCCRGLFSCKCVFWNVEFSDILQCFDLRGHFSFVWRREEEREKKICSGFLLKYCRVLTFRSTIQSAASCLFLLAVAQTQHFLPDLYSLGCN